MIGLNSGLLGVRRVPTVGSASGLWVPNEQSLAKRAAIWPTTGDPYFADVSLLLHMDGSNGSTTFTDSSSNALTVTANGNAQISTAQSKFGGASGLFDGTGDYLTTPTSSAFAITGDFTVEFFAYINATANNNYAFLHINAGGDNGLHIYYYQNTLRVDNGLVAAYSGSANLLPSSTWKHIAVSKSGSTVYTFVDGNLEDTRTAQSYGTPDRVQVARFSTGGITNDGNCYIDDLRITKGVARYTANFTPPTAAFPNA